VPLSLRHRSPRASAQTIGAALVRDSRRRYLSERAIAERRTSDEHEGHAKSVDGCGDESLGVRAGSDRVLLGIGEIRQSACVREGRARARRVRERHNCRRDQTSKRGARWQAAALGLSWARC